MGNSLPVSACEACNVYRFCKSCAFGCFQCLNTIIIAFIIIYHAIVFFDVCECKITRYCDNLDIFCFFLLLGLFRIILCFNGTVYSFFCGTVRCYLYSVQTTFIFYLCVIVQEVIQKSVHKPYCVHSSRPSELFFVYVMQARRETNSSYWTVQSRKWKKGRKK